MSEDAEYLTMTQIAERHGIQYRSMVMRVNKLQFPEPDLILLGRRLWLLETVEAYEKLPPGRKYRSWPHAKRRKTKKGKPSKKPSESIPRRQTLPGKAKIHGDGVTGGGQLPTHGTVLPEIAQEVAAAVRADGHHCTAPDVQELARVSPDGLDYERRKLQQRIQRKLRGIKQRG